MNFYYKYSPAVDDFIAKHAKLREIIRVSLLPVLGVSGVVLQFGILSTIVLMFFLGIALIGFLNIKRKKIKI